MTQKTKKIWIGVIWFVLGNLAMYFLHSPAQKLVKLIEGIF